MLIGLTKITGDQKKKVINQQCQTTQKAAVVFEFPCLRECAYACVKSTWMNHWDIGLIMKNIKFNSCNKVHQSKKRDQVRSYLAGIFEHGLAVGVKLFTV